MEKVRDISIILGPPGREEFKLQVEEAAKQSEQSRDEIWLEIVHNVLKNHFMQKSPDSASEFDSLLSDMLKTPVRVTDPFLTFYFSDGVHSPCITLYPSKILAPGGEQLEIDWTNPQLREDIGSIFGYLFGTEWVNTMVAYEPLTDTSTSGDDESQDDVNDDDIIIFEGDTDWSFQLHQDFEICEWIASFFSEFEHMLRKEEIDAVFQEFPKLNFFDYPCTLDAVLSLLSDAYIDSQEFWEGPGPVSGNYNRIMLPKNKVKGVIDDLWSLARRLQTLVTPEELEYHSSPLPEKREDSHE